MIRIRAIGAREAARHLNDIADRLEDSREALGALTDDMFDLQTEWWNTLGRGAWPRNRAGTLASDRREGLDTRLMRNRGDLERASTREGASGQRIDLQDDALIFEVTVPYAVPLAERGRSAVVEPTDRDADRLAETYLNELLDA